MGKEPFESGGDRLMEKKFICFITREPPGY